MNIPETPEEAAVYLESSCGLRNVVCKNWGEKASGFSLFEGYLGEDRIFIKWGGKSGNCFNDYTYTRRLYEKHPDFFFRPYFCINEGGVQCMGLEYAEGRTLKSALMDGSLSVDEKSNLAHTLPCMAKALIEANCVHRDIKPDNFFLTRDGGIKLFDFEFATDAEPYAEREEILRYPYYIAVVGTKSECGVALGIGRFMWDDMVIFHRILQRIDKSEPYDEIYDAAESFFRSESGKRVLRFPGRQGLILRRKLVDLIAALLPLRSWRHQVRMLNRKARF